MKRLAIMLLAAVAAIGASAQELNKEIFIERTFKPSLGNISRVNTFPTVMQPQVDVTSLTFSDMSTAVMVPAAIDTLSPAIPARAIPRSPYRGYAALGYFPAFNLGASAGYRIIEKPLTRLGAWVQYDGVNYDDENDLTLKRNSVTVGADYTRIFPRTGRIDIKADFSYNHLNRPWETVDPNYSTRRVDARATWSARNRAMGYFIEGEFNHFDLDNVEHSLIADDVASRLAQNAFSLSGGTTLSVGETSTVAALADIDIVRYNHFNTLSFNDNHYQLPAIIPDGGKTMSLVTLRPSYRLNAGMISLNLGARLQLTVNSGHAFHVAPEVRVGIKPVSCLNIVADLGGGEHINCLSSLFDINPYMSPSIAYAFSHSPITAEVRAEIGPFAGASVEIFGGYAASNDWLMPVAYTPDCTAFAPTDLRSWRIGARANWRYADLFELSASFTANCGGVSHAWYSDYDRARRVLAISAHVTPIERLSIDASLDMRFRRSITDAFGLGSISLHDATHLNLGAAYQILDWVSVFGRVENLLNHRALMLALHEQQGIHGFVGVELKF